MNEEEKIIKDKLLVNALNRIDEIRYFTEFDLSNPDFVEALSRCQSLIVNTFGLSVTDDTVQELKKLLSYMPRLTKLSITSRGKEKVDVSPIFDTLGDNIENLSLTNVNFDTNKRREERDGR